jgi:adenylate cyclase
MAEDGARSSAGGGHLDMVADWLMTQALGDPDVEALLEGCCDRLRAVGVPLMRAHVTFRILHPLFAAQGLTWRRGEGVQSASYAHGVHTADVWRRSPLFHMIDTHIPFVRRRLVGEEALLDFPVLTEFRDAGVTDYLGYLVAFGGATPDEPHQGGIVGSWATDRPAGFSDREIRALARIQRRLAVAFKVAIKNQIARNIVTTYLGPDPGRRVLGGRIKHGDVEAIHAVIWLSDLRDSTRMADTMPPEAFLAVLNSSFECTAGAVLAHGGEVLLFIGDAVLAIFPIHEAGATPRQACEAALAAMRDAQARLHEVNRRRTSAKLEALSFGLGLHLGDLMYGNIGVPERLQFTVVGPAANEVARLEGLTKVLDRPVLASAEFARNLDIPWRSLGRHELRGVGAPIEIFAPPDN